MDNNEIIKMVKDHVGFYQDDRWFTVEEIGDGNNNFVYRVNDVIGRRGVIVKQAPPYLRVAGEGYKLTDLRANREALALAQFNAILDGSAPRVYHFDDAKKTIIMEDLSEMSIMRYEMMRMRTFPGFPERMGEIIASYAFMTSDLHLDAEQKQANVARHLNPELCALVERLVFVEPFYDAPDNRVHPELRAAVEAIWNDAHICREAARMKALYLTKAQSFIHGDLHTGSIFIGDSGCKIFDPEFAFYGPTGYDLGVLMANFLLNIASLSGRSDIPADEKDDYRKYVLELAVDTYAAFEHRFRELFCEAARSELQDDEALCDAHLRDIAQDAVGFAACEMVRRIIGLARVPDIESVRDVTGKLKAQRVALDCAKKLFGCGADIKERSVESVLRTLMSE